MALLHSVPSETLSETNDAVVFPQFDVVTDSSDHYYVRNKNTGTLFQKKIMQEWKILEKNLPDSIYVRVYEDRIDLLRAVIVGAAGTPYHDGLYFFDIAFPSDYPSKPPSVCYRSLGFRINPNLYPNGRVCLSLLNTWSGTKIEKWSPNQSTILQVLVSIQALVLNEKPYFNEPGFHGFQGVPWWEKKSDSYNKDVFVLCCKTMLIHMRVALKHFEAFVAGHFKERGHAILTACIAYANGRAKIGHFNKMSSSSFSSVKVSKNFKRSIEQLYPQLYVAFSKNGASLGTLVEQFEVEKKGVVKKKGSGGVAKRIFGRLMKVFGLSKKSGQVGL